ncbi:hypothetical protein P691DRAFT_768886 [Macrolepiota fuliginosa MF-IS2]|uniref:Uncharacterized protein n=1 Tax=Macrolepiota fuliginosa MF-IS2 TaxID=1400762 RepID=A0A9P5WWY3_9AGAR|nr:hypothetical protein P691DRAFT_768886 [Macrolepiota fuliginosa MF-IS2]
MAPAMTMLTVMMAVEAHHCWRITVNNTGHRTPSDTNAHAQLMGWTSSSYDNDTENDLAPIGSSMAICLPMTLSILPPDPDLLRATHYTYLHSQGAHLVQYALMINTSLAGPKTYTHNNYGLSYEYGYKAPKMTPNQVLPKQGNQRRWQKVSKSSMRLS